MNQAERQAELEALAEQSYDQLTGEWKDWLEVAKRYERKIPVIDRLDYRHSTIIELHRARQRDRKPLPTLRAYRIASLMVASYWREVNKGSVRVCIYSGLPKEPNCKECERKPNRGQVCPWIARRPVQSLDTEVEDAEGNIVKLIDTVASEDVHDMPEAWYELNTWLLGYPTRLVEIAEKRRDGEPLSAKDRKYWSRYFKKAQKSLF